MYNTKASFPIKEKSFPLLIPCPTLFKVILGFSKTVKGDKSNVVRFQVLLVAIALLVEAVSSSGTSTDICQTTRRNIPEDNLFTGCIPSVKMCAVNCSRFQISL
jgi:hypothetical protein